MISPKLIAFAAAALLLRTAAATEEPPDAAAIASKIGQEIEFQDEVKAVSFSRSTKGYYLSFGAPYPKQVLSVWTDRAIYDQLPFTRKLVGRTVRIRGRLELSPTGPLLKLTSLDQFEVVETDEAILAQPVLDGKLDRHRFKAAVSQNLARDEFDKLETLAAELLQSREESADGALLLDCFLYAFIVPVNAPAEDFAFLQGKLAAWSMKHRYHDLFRETAVSWEIMASGFQYLIKQHPQSEYLKNVYAFFCWKARDRVRLRQTLPEIRANPDMQIWVNLENVALAEKLANGARP